MSHARLRHAILTNADDRWIAEAPGLLRCSIVAKTRVEALRRLKESIRRRIEELEEEGEAIPRDLEVETVVLDM